MLLEGLPPPPWGLSSRKFSVLIMSSPKPSGGFLEEAQQRTSCWFTSGNSFGFQSLKPDPSNGRRKVQEDI